MVPVVVYPSFRLNVVSTFCPMDVFFWGGGGMNLLCNVEQLRLLGGCTKKAGNNDGGEIIIVKFQFILMVLL